MDLCIYVCIYTVNTRQNYPTLNTKKYTEDRHQNMIRQKIRKHENTRKGVATPAPVRGVAVIEVCQAGHSSLSSGLITFSRTHATPRMQALLHDTVIASLGG